MHSGFWLLVADIGLEVYDSLSPGPRAVAGLFQGLAARASGFSIVNVSAVAPALQCVSLVLFPYPFSHSYDDTDLWA